MERFKPKDNKQRQGVSQISISCRKFPIEIGRYSGLPRVRREFVHYAKWQLVQKNTI